MRIGRDENFIAIERITSPAPGCACRVEAVITGAGCKFSAAHNKVVIEPSEEMFDQGQAFFELTEHQLDLQLSEGGWLRFKRNSKGCIIVHYRLVRWEKWAAIEGEILIEPEFSPDFCRELKALLYNGL